jgi:ribosome-binding factor A
MARGRVGWPGRSRSTSSGRPRAAVHGPKGRAAHKTAQLCKQVLETLEMVLAEQEDEILQGLHVASVEAGPDATQLLVTLTPGPGLEATADPLAILERLHAAAGDLRTEVASAITRRRVPTLLYRIGEPPPAV